MGVTELNRKDELIYPNPVNKNFYLKNMEMKNFNIHNLKLTDIYGKEIKFSYQLSENIIITLDEDLPAGFYFLEYVNNEKIFCEKLIKSN
jgi:hypothetical protein